MKSILVSVAKQQLQLLEAGSAIASYPISTSSKGIGESKNSYQTPSGRMYIRAKIGDGLPSGAVLIGRRPTGEICSKAMMEAEPERDWVLSRIMWLSGLELGVNRLGSVDTMQRFIYLHGTPYEELLGTAASRGCIRMGNAAVIELFAKVDCGTELVVSYVE